MGMWIARYLYVWLLCRCWKDVERDQVIAALSLPNPPSLQGPSCERDHRQLPQRVRYHSLHSTPRYFASAPIGNAPR
jgi:hypothetical protein